MIRASLKGQLPGGEYTFPFEFHLPPDAPPSLVQFTRDGSLVETEYAITGCVMNYWVKEVIIVRSYMPSSQYNLRSPAVSRLSHFDRTFCCCVDNGRTGLHLELPYNAYIFGKDKSINGVVVIDNSESKSPCQELTVQLVRTSVKRLYDWDGNWRRRNASQISGHCWA